MTRIRIGEPLPYTTTSGLSYHHPTRVVTLGPGEHVDVIYTAAGTRDETDWQTDTVLLETSIYLDRVAAGVTCSPQTFPDHVVPFRAGIPDQRDGRSKGFFTACFLFLTDTSGNHVDEVRMRLHNPDPTQTVRIAGLAQFDLARAYRLGANPSGTTPWRLVQPALTQEVAGHREQLPQGAPYIEETWDIVTPHQADVAFWERMARRDWARKGPVLIDYADLAQDANSRFYLMMPARPIDIQYGSVLARVRVVWREAV